VSHSTQNMSPHYETWMRQALIEARAAMGIDEVPVGAVVVRDERVIGRGHNQKEKLTDPTAHAEMLALTAAAEYLRDWRLTGCTLYVTLEPCPMCAGAIVLARLDRVVFAATDPKFGACGSLYSIPTDRRTNHQADVVGGICADEAADLLRTFFARQRAAGKK